MSQFFPYCCNLLDFLLRETSVMLFTHPNGKLHAPSQQKKILKQHLENIFGHGCNIDNLGLKLRLW